MNCYAPGSAGYAVTVGIGQLKNWGDWNLFTSYYLGAAQRGTWVNDPVQFVDAGWANGKGIRGD